MRMVYTFFFTLAVILNSIELSSQTDLNPNRERDYSSSPSARQHSSDRTSAEELPLRGRSRSPQSMPPSFEVLGYTIGELGYIRLRPRSNPNLEFEFRKYVFPDGKPIRLKAGRTKYVHVPHQEYIVLSTSSGDIFAILDYSGVLRGIYKTNSNRSRVKMNMISGTVEKMTSDEVRDCPVGKKYPIFPQTFTKVVTNSNSLQSELNLSSERNLGSSSSARERSPDLNSPEYRLVRANSSSPPGRPPTHNVLGYALGQLGYIRLIPQTNQNQRFEFRRYIFPIAKRIQLLIGHGRFVPVPFREHIVLTTSTGDVFAILEYSGILRGIYKTSRDHTRIKINVVSGAIDNMTADEIKECKVGIDYPIFPIHFREVITNSNSLETLYQ